MDELHHQEVIDHLFGDEEEGMSVIFQGKLPIEVFEDDAGQVCIKQVSDSGEEQSITLGLMQAEHLANWCIQYAQSATEDLMEE